MACHGIHAFMDTNRKYWVDTVFWKSMEMESEYSMEVAVESTEFHGNIRDGSGSANARIIRCILSDRV